MRRSPSRRRNSPSVKSSRTNQARRRARRGHGRSLLRQPRRCSRSHRLHGETQAGMLTGNNGAGRHVAPLHNSAPRTSRIVALLLEASAARQPTKPSGRISTAPDGDTPKASTKRPCGSRSAPRSTWRASSGRPRSAAAARAASHQAPPSAAASRTLGEQIQARHRLAAALEPDVRRARAWQSGRALRRVAVQPALRCRAPR